MTLCAPSPAGLPRDLPLAWATPDSPAARVSVGALRPGDVLIFGVYSVECEERLCSDLISCFNAWGQWLFPGRFAGVPASWACHTAIYAGEGRMIHATGPGATFLLACDDAASYFEEHPRVVTVFRCQSEALGRRAAALALALASSSGVEHRFSACELLVRMTLQALFSGRHDQPLADELASAARERRSCLFPAAGLVSCSSFVSTLLRLAAEAEGDRSAMRDVPGDVSPYELFSTLIAHPSWRAIVLPQPAASAPAFPVDHPGARAQGAALRWLWLLGSLGFVGLVVLAFGLGFGRRFQAMALAG